MNLCRFSGGRFGGPYRNRTYNQWIKSPLLCLIELTALFFILAVKDGVDDGIRTHDDRVHNPGLYQLSYAHHRLIISWNDRRPMTLQRTHPQTRRARQDSNLQPSA